jgi:lysophospholipid acyltransferase (LPLAT)-like uncharacterized protein
VTGFERVEKLMQERSPLVLITWHGRMIVSVWFARRRNIVAMISRHGDGEMVARLVERMGYETVRGSSTRGGTQATLEMLEKVRAGQPAAMICDGPRGPIYQMKSGAPYLAQQTHATVIPVAFAANREWAFRSWDRFAVPKPFAKVRLVWGEPIAPKANDADTEAFRIELENALNELTQSTRNAMANEHAMTTAM